MAPPSRSKAALPPTVLSNAALTLIWSAKPAISVPATGTLIQGLAGQISVNAAFDRAVGGNAALLRDGGANGLAYRYNTANVSGFQGRISSLLGGFDQQQNFDPQAQLSASDTVSGFATQSAGWLEGQRATANDKATASQATMSRAKDALLRTTGVSLDQEMAAMLSLEQSYQASAKVMTTVNQMFTALTDIVR